MRNKIDDAYCKFWEDKCLGTPENFLTDNRRKKIENLIGERDDYKALRKYYYTLPEEFHKGQSIMLMIWNLFYMIMVWPF